MLLFILTALVAAQDSCPGPAAGVAAVGGPPAPCADAEHRQFDFWVGQWDV